MSDVVRFQCEVPMTEFLDIDGGWIAYKVTGHGPLVGLSHSIGDYRQVYRFLTPELAQAGYRVANTDLRGHGASAAARHRPPAATSPAYSPDL
jgi:alpha-beta hydrolase superfamily lysophospholipase